MTEKFGILPSGEEAHLYTISCGSMTACIADFGATLVKLFVPDRDGKPGDVVLGYDDANAYNVNGGCAGATVGRNSNRVGLARMTIGGKVYAMAVNNNRNNLHSGPDFWFRRMWHVDCLEDTAITLSLDTPDGDQGLPGAGHVTVTYALTGNALRITYKGLFDQDTVFNMTNHSYFNLAGHEHPEKAMDQLLTLRASHFTAVDHESIPTGIVAPVKGTVLDFSAPKALGRNRGQEPLLAPQNGIDHNFVLDSADFSLPSARLEYPGTGRVMEVYTDCPGIQVYCGNFMENEGKGGVTYPRNCGVCLETQFAPDSMNHPEWPQPRLKANTEGVSVTEFRFSVK